MDQLVVCGKAKNVVDPVAKVEAPRENDSARRKEDHEEGPSA
jgi:hypothetical protein